MYKLIQTEGAARRGEFDPAVEALLSQIRGELA